MADGGTATIASRPAVGVLLCLLVATLVGCLWTLVYRNATTPVTVCTHGESSIAISILHGQVKIIRPATKTGCAP